MPAALPILSLYVPSGLTTPNQSILNRPCLSNLHDPFLFWYNLNLIIELDPSWSYATLQPIDIKSSPAIAFFNFQCFSPQHSLTWKAIANYGISKILRRHEHWTGLWVNCQLPLSSVLVLVQVLPLKKRANSTVLSVRWSSKTLLSSWIKQLNSPCTSGIPYKCFCCLSQAK